MSHRSLIGSVLVAVLSIATPTLAQPQSTIVEYPSVPTGLTAQVVGSTVTLSWTASFDATTYGIDAGSAPGVTDIGQLAATGTTLSVPNVPPGNYFVRVRAANDAGVSAASPDVLVTVGTACALPSPPTSLTAAVDGRSVTLQWSGTGPFRLEAGTAPGTSNVFAGDVGSATTLGATAAGGVYYARVFARNACGLSLPSDEHAIHVLVPPAPTLGGWSSDTSTGTSRVTLHWTPGAGPAPAGYVLEAGSAPGLADIASVRVDGATTTLSARVFRFETYYVRVRAASADGVGPPSNEVSLTPAPPGVGTSSVTFNSLTGTATTPFTSHTERGYLVEPVSGDWTLVPNAIKLESPTPAVETTGAVRVTAGGASFRLESLNLFYETTASFTLTGTLAGNPVFSVTTACTMALATCAGTKITSPFPNALVDALIISVTTRGVTTGVSAVGLDDIVLRP